ncbi:MAG TPA: hypothetical protein VGJ82_07440 [Thermoanaerobaculia bacterium]
MRSGGKFLLAFLVLGCASSHTGNEAPFVAGTPLDQVHAVRELMRVRATHGERTESFKAQLLVEPKTNRVELTAYTPLGTSAMTLYAEGDRVTFLNHIAQTQWTGNASDVAIFGGIAPAEWATKIVNGQTTIRRGADTVEITPLQIVATDASPQPPAIPREYRCCVAPAL